jgi:hypothetical protein
MAMWTFDGVGLIVIFRFRDLVESSPGQFRAVENIHFSVS